MTKQTSQWQIGNYVLAQYKTGEYIGRVHDFTSSRVVVEVLAVASHPEQGDLHHPQQADVPFFHQRKALAKHERALVYEHQLRPWVSDIPDYQQSLKQAWEMERQRMKQHPERAWAERGLTELDRLAAEYQFE
jgi:kinase-associated protein B